MSETPDNENAEVTDPHAAPKPLSALQMMGSALSAALGVQSSKNRVRDFEQGKATHFIVIGIVFTLVFVVGMISLVRLVLSSATG